MPRKARKPTTTTRATRSKSKSKAKRATPRRRRQRAPSRVRTTPSQPLSDFVDPARNFTPFEFNRQPDPILGPTSLLPIRRYPVVNPYYVNWGYPWVHVIKKYKTLPTPAAPAPVAPVVPAPVVAPVPVPLVVPGGAAPGPIGVGPGPLPAAAPPAPAGHAPAAPAPATAPMPALTRRRRRRFY